MDDETREKLTELDAKNERQFKALKASFDHILILVKNLGEDVSGVVKKLGVYNEDADL